MALPNAPMTSDYQKILLQYMDPNKRVSLVRRCPSLEAPDSEVPQNIESIGLQPGEITINNTLYRLGVIQQYPKDKFVPQWHRELNDRGGMHWDVDKFGFEAPTPEETPGEFRLSAKRRTEEGIRRDCEEQLKGWCEVWEKRWKKKKSKEAIMQMRKEQGFEVPPGTIDDLKDLNYAIVEVESEILRYQSKLDDNYKNIPFTAYLQLTIATEGPDVWEIQKIERMKYTGNLGSAMKYLIGKLLKKPTMNYVNRSRIDPCDHRDCYWLPTELKLSVRHLIIERLYESVMRTVGGFFHGINPRPFELITIEQVEPSLQINTIPHRRLHFDYCVCYNDQRFIGLLDHWKTHGAPIGTHYTANTNPTQMYCWWFNLKRREGCRLVRTPTRECHCQPECVILPMPINAQLEFYITKSVDHPWKMLLNFEVQPRQEY